MPKEMKHVHSKTCTYVHSSITDKSRNNQSTDERPNKIQYIHTMKYYSVIKRSTDTCYNMGILHYVKQKKPVTKTTHNT